MRSLVLDMWSLRCVLGILLDIKGETTKVEVDYSHLQFRGEAQTRDKIGVIHI